MITGRFGDTGQLLFEIELIAADGESFPVEVLLDTCFTTGWLAMNIQDIEILGWPLMERRRAMRTARGEEFFRLYAGKVLLDEQEFNIPVVAAIELPENLLGLQWLQTLRLVVDFPARVLTLG
ncbi:hypothetical protein [Kamptonema formosum]|uniref:hypothetical protein n=1 Tax=Kamptonema formosum TaxID=331992 RepID=UPI0003604DE2|nr:hypothetical protein [Oscillatoria sp. PCC 10802]